MPSRSARYTPDFVLPNGIIIETKGRFTTEDRQKMRLIKLQYPQLDIRFVFSNANARIAKQSKTTLAKWAETYGFPWAHKDLPKEWLTEPTQAGKLETLKSLIPAVKGGKAFSST